MTVLATIAMIVTLLGAVAVYLGSPNQLAFSRPLPRKPLTFAGLVAIVLGLLLLLQWAGPATAVFIAFTLVMLVWSLVPLAAAWRRGDRKASR